MKEEKKKAGCPVISVRDISMYFKVPEESASSLKEFTVQLAAGRRRYRTLKALDHISFDVYKGEILGLLEPTDQGRVPF